MELVYLSIACFVFGLAAVFYLSHIPEITDADMNSRRPRPILARTSRSESSIDYSTPRSLSSATPVRRSRFLRELVFLRLVSPTVKLTVR